MEADSNVEQTTEVAAENSVNSSTKEADNSNNNSSSSDALSDAIAKAISSNEQSEGGIAPDKKTGEKPVTADEPKSATQVDELKAPDHWAAEDKALYDQIADPQAKKTVLQIHKKMEAAHTRRSQEFAPYKELDKFWEPYKQYGTIQNALSYYMGIDQQLNTNPITGLKNLAKLYNIDLTKLSGQAPNGHAQTNDNGDSEEFDDPRVSKLEQTTGRVEQWIQQQETNAELKRKQDAQAQIDTFKAEKDESGNLKYPHFDALEPEMKRLFETGFAKTLPELYDKALKLDPVLGPQEFERSNAAKREAEEKARLEEVKKAQNASRHLSGTGHSRAAPRIRTLDEAIEAALS